MSRDNKIKEERFCLLSEYVSEIILDNDYIIEHNKNYEVHDNSVNSMQKQSDFCCMSIKLQVEEILPECDIAESYGSVKPDIKAEVWFQDIQSNSSALRDHNYCLSQNVDKENIAVPTCPISDTTESPLKFYKKDSDAEFKTNIASLKYPSVCLEKLDMENYENCISNNVNVETEQFSSKMGISNVNKNFKEHSKTPYFCEVCGKDFKHLSRLNVHRNTHARKKHCCEICGKTFARISNLNIHKNIHYNLKPYACNLCSKAFTDKSSLNRHKLSHTDEKPHKCDHCGIYFARLYLLRRHRRTHTGEKPFACDLCRKLFTVKENLLIHNKNVHSDDKPYICDVCDRGFKMLHHLRRHRLIHIGEKPFICDTCGKAFTQRCTLKEHINEHTGNKPFKCSLCDMRFARSASLNYHKLSHTIMSCHICGKRFKCKQYLKKHVKLHCC